MKTIGSVCEGPTDQIVIKSVIDKLTGEENRYYKLQPEETPAGKNGNGWKGVLKWCRDNWDEREKLMHQVQPEIAHSKERSIHWIVIKLQKIVPHALSNFHVRITGYRLEDT